MNSFKAKKKKVYLQTSPSLKNYLVAYRIYSFIYNVFFSIKIFILLLLLFSIKREQTRRETGFKLCPKLLRCLVW